MSRRLQVIMSTEEYDALARAARRQGRPVSEVVRESVRKAVAEEPAIDPDRRIAAILRFARFAGPTGDVDQLLAEIEQGRALA